MTDRKYWLACAGLVMLLPGCVERRFVIDSEPKGAMVYVNDRPVGHTPCDMPFLFYGTYRIQLELDGYQTLIEDKRISPPWYAYPPIDFLAENVYPFKASDIQRLDKFVLSPLPRPNLDELRAEAEELRERGQALPPPSHPVEPPAVRNPPPPGNPSGNRGETVPPPLDMTP